MISGVTKKLDYLIVGEDAGQSKLEKANELNIKQINEDQFLELICQKRVISIRDYRLLRNNHYPKLPERRYVLLQLNKWRPLQTKNINAQKCL